MLYFTYLPRSPPWTDLHQILHGGRIPDVITCAKFYDNRLRGFGSTGGRFWHSPLTKAVAVNTVLAIPRSPLYSRPGEVQFRSHASVVASGLTLTFYVFSLSFSPSLFALCVSILCNVHVGLQLCASYLRR